MTQTTTLSLSSKIKMVSNGGQSLRDSFGVRVFSREEQPNFGQSLPYKGETLPFKGETLPLKGETLPYKGETLPFKGETLPYKGKTLPYKGGNKGQIT